MSIQNFFTRQDHNEARKLTLIDSDKTEFYLEIIGTESDTFFHHKKQVEKDYLLQALTGSPWTDQEFEVKTICGLVVGWNFPEDFTKENVELLLREAPHIRDKINRLSCSSEFFSKKNLKSFTNGLNSESDSKDHQKDQSNPDETI